MNKLLCIILFTSLNYSQNKPIGSFEPKSFLDEDIYNLYQTEHKYNLKIDENDNFIINSDWIGGCTMAEYHTTGGICKYKKDTLILISPLSKKYIENITDSISNLNKFIFSIRNFSTANVDMYFKNLNFYFIDTEMNQRKAFPEEIKAKFNNLDTQSRENENELLLTFKIPDKSLYFTIKDHQNYNNVTLNVIDIEGKYFKLVKNYHFLEKKYNKHGETYFDVTLTKYIINKNKNILKGVKKSQNYEYRGNLFLKK